MCIIHDEKYLKKLTKENKGIISVIIHYFSQGPTFEIENNILRGKQVAPFDDIGIWNIGKQILNTLRQKPDFVGQVLY